MTSHPSEDGSLWPKPAMSARRRRLRTLLMAVLVALVVLLIVLHLESYLYPQMTVNHA